jgi:Uma2 family endonuclease
MTAELAADQLVSPEEYLRAEELADWKHEYLNGVVYAMAGAQQEHNRIAMNIGASLHFRLAGSPCEPFGSDMKVHIEAAGDVRFYYPDVQVVCDAMDGVYQDGPVLIAEVISESTRRIDTGEKLQGYLKLPSLQLSVLVETKSPLVVAHRRTGDLFHREVYSGKDATIPLPFLNTELPLAEIYARMNFAPPA